MKHRLSLLAVLLMAMVLPSTAAAYTFSAVAPTGQTLYYNIVNGEAQVTYQRNDNNYPYSSYYSPLSGSLEIPNTVIYNGNTYLVTSIGERAFYGCPDLTNITIPDGVTSIGFRAFDHCSGLTSITLPEGVTDIGAWAFYGCGGLTNINIPDGVTSIGTYTFFACHSLTSIILPNGLTSIGNYAFQGCTSLTSLTFPDSMASIGGYAFKDCTGLISVTLPRSLAEILSQAFSGCTNLIEIVSNAVVAPTLVNDAFYNVPTTASVYIPCGSQESYVTLGWTFFSNINESLSPYLLTVQSNNEIMGFASITTSPNCESDSATIEATANAGYRFVRWSDGSTGNPRTLMVTKDTSITAIFEAPFDVIVNNAVGAGVYYSGSTAMVYALPQVDLQFDGWSDGETANPRYIVVTSDTTLTALFRAPDTVRVYDTTTVYDTVINIVYDTVINIVYDTTEYNHYYYDTTRTFDTLVVYDTTRVFDTMVYVNVDTLHHYYYDTTRTFDTLVVYDTTRVFDTMVYVNVDTLHHYYYDTTRTFDTLVVYDTTRVFDTMVYVNVDTLHHYYYDTTSVTHYVFDSTWVFDSVYIFDTIYIHDTVYVGVGEVETINAKIYTNLGQIVVEGAEGNSVRLYDINGRILATRQDEYTPLRFDVPATGAYLVKIGNLPARRVLVVR